MLLASAIILMSARDKMDLKAQESGFSWSSKGAGSGQLMEISLANCRSDQTLGAKSVKFLDKTQKNLAAQAKQNDIYLAVNSRGELVPIVFRDIYENEVPAATQDKIRAAFQQTQTEQ